MIVRAGAVLTVAYLCGAIPFANLAARRLRGVDLRSVGTGTVSGTGLYRIAGFAPLVVAGLLDIAKGTVGPLLAGSGRPVLAGLAGGMTVVGHNWSVFLGGAGGRGLAPAMGALLVQAWPGVLLLLAALGLGRLLGHTALGAFVGLVALVPTAAVLAGAYDAFAAACVAVPIVIKRITGNAPPPAEERRRVLRNRVLFDRDGGTAR